MPSDTTPSDTATPSRAPRIINWVFTAFNGLLLIPAIIFAMLGLYRSAPGGQDDGLALYMNVAIVLLPITIIIATLTAWIYHRGNWHRTSYYCHMAPLANIALVIVLRLAQ